jgi:DNA-directed RNA polymerase subunit F
MHFVISRERIHGLGNSWLSLRKLIGWGKLGLWWKEYTAPVKTDEGKVAFNIERIRELVQKLPEELAEKINRVLPKTPDTSIPSCPPVHVHPHLTCEIPKKEEKIPPAKERRWLTEDLFVELGEDGRLRLFQLNPKNPSEKKLIAVSKETYTRIAKWSIYKAFPELWGVA